MDLQIPAIQSGIDARDYWTLTYAEIEATIAAYNRQLNLEVELRKQSAYTTAMLTAQFVGLSMFSKKPLPSYEDCFTPTGEAAIESQKQRVSLYEQQWSAFAIEHNRRRAKKNGG
jgi:hypothetical protein